MQGAVSMSKMIKTHARSKNNPLDICTKVMPGGNNKNNFTQQVLYNTP